MSHRRPGPLARALALLPVAGAALAAACADVVSAPAPRAAAAPALNAAPALTVPAFAAIDPALGFQEGFTHLFPVPPATAADLNVPVDPLPWNPENWSVVQHVRDPQWWDKVETMHAWHGTKCERPDNSNAELRTHPVASYDSLVFFCRNHMMTATNSGPGGYAVTYLTPDRMLDFSSGTAVLRFDVATDRKSGRDWIGLWLTPYEDNLVAPLDDSLPDLQGEPRRGLHVRMRAERLRSAFVASVIRNHAATRLAAATADGYEAAFAARGLTQSATRRDTFELHVSRTRLRFGMPRYGLWWVDAPIPGGALDWSRAVVQIGHHSFDPSSDPTPGVDGSASGPSTWHWDNVGLQPAAPFTVLRANRRAVDQRTPDGEVVFPRGAPAGAHIRFAAIGSTEVLFVDGRTGGDDDDDGPRWTLARRQTQERLVLNRFSSFWMPVPQGTTRVRFRPVRPLLFLSGGRWTVRDIAVWSPTAGTVLPPSPPGDDEADDEDDDDRPTRWGRSGRGDG